MNTKYTTKDGERIDQIAYAAYGDPKNWTGIIDANPTLPITPNVGQGLSLRVPIVGQQTLSDNSENLPPWKK
jgi:phage tail protein X